jgi:hypothetical protein
MSSNSDNHPGCPPIRAGWNRLDSRLAIWVLTWALFATCIIFAGCEQESAAAGQASTSGSPASAPDLASAADKLGVTEQELIAALGDTSQGAGDPAAAAQALG